MSGYQSSSAADRVAVDAAPSPPIRLRLGGADARAVARSLRRARAVLGPLTWSLVVLNSGACASCADGTPGFRPRLRPLPPGRRRRAIPRGLVRDTLSRSPGNP